MDLHKEKFMISTDHEIYLADEIKGDEGGNVWERGETVHLLLWKVWERGETVHLLL